MPLPALGPPPQPFDIWVEFNDVCGGGRTTVPADCAEPGVDLAIDVQLVAGDHEGNRVLATVTGLAWARDGGDTVDLALHMESFVPAPTDERETMIAFIRNPGASVPPGDPKPDLGVIASAGLAWRSPTDNAETGCLQVAVADHGVFMRDSADPSKVFAFTTAEFTAFCGAVCAGRYRDILPRVV